MRNIITCPICGGHMESTYDMTDTYECDVCDCAIGEGVLLGDYNFYKESEDIKLEKETKNE